MLLTVMNRKLCQHNTPTISIFSDLCYTAYSNDRLKGKYSTAGCEDLPFKRYSSLARSLSLSHSLTTRRVQTSFTVLLICSPAASTFFITLLALVLLSSCNIVTFARTASGVPR